MSKKDNKLRDSDISRFFNISTNTIQDFKKSSQDNWRYKVYKFISSKNYNDIELFMQDLKNENSR